jgi:hypothetical protein
MVRNIANTSETLAMRFDAARNALLTGIDLPREYGSIVDGKEHMSVRPFYVSAGTLIDSRESIAIAKIIDFKTDDDADTTDRLIVVAPKYSSMFDGTFLVAVSIPIGEWTQDNHRKNIDTYIQHLTKVGRSDETTAEKARKMTYIRRHVMLYEHALKIEGIDIPITDEEKIVVVDARINNINDSYVELLSKLIYTNKESSGE